MNRYCLDCDYPLQAAHDHRCPECGHPFHPDDPGSFSPFPRAFGPAGRRSLRGLVTCVLIVAAVMLLIRATQGPILTSALGVTFYILLGLGLVIWIEIRHVRRQFDRNQRLTDAADWDELIRQNDRLLRSKRPLLLLLRNVVQRGSFEVNAATDLYIAGRLDEALALTDLALSRARADTWIAAALDLRAKTYFQLGRYDPMRADLETLGKMPNRAAGRETSLAMLEVYEGNVAQGAARAAAVESLPNHPDINSARIMASAGLWYMGRFDEALAAIDHPLVDLFGGLDAKLAGTLVLTVDGMRRLDHGRMIYARHMVTGRLHAAARVHVARRQFDKATQALDEVDALFGDGPLPPWSKHEHLGYRALCAAEAGDAETAMKSLHAMWDISNRLPAPSLLHASPHFAGIVALALGHFDEATAMFEQALAHSVHPIQRHHIHHWLAVTAAKAGLMDKATPHYDRVIADGFDTWMRREAMAQRPM